MEQIDPDRGRAIVRLARRAMRDGGKEKPLVEILKTTGDMGIIVVGPSQVLSQLPFVRLVEVAPARYLLALASGHNFKALEIAITDILDDMPHGDERERALIMQRRKQIKRLRKSENMSRGEILFARSRDS